MTRYSRDNDPISYEKTTAIDTREEISIDRMDRRSLTRYGSRFMEVYNEPMEHNGSLLDHYKQKKREVFIIRQNQKVVDAKTRYNLSVVEGKKSILDNLKVDKEIIDAKQDLELWEEHGRIKKLRLEAERARLEKEKEESIVAKEKLRALPEEEELAQFREQLKIKMKRAAITMQYNLFEYEEDIKTRYHITKKRKETLDELRMTQYAEVLKGTPLSSATEKQLEKIRQIDEDIESLEMEMADKDSI